MKMPDVNLVVTTFNQREELQINGELIEGAVSSSTGLSRLISNIRERGYQVPSNPSITKSESGVFTVH